ncbi:hypothetical protein HPB47_001600 [Ixodes persulcatus]|uniref:Uncharacterized protein n=1 Tax=Ixodes persulcatus TaxID=34615 RepID=A0AC60PPC5_IXOPE|nr:hypothetical protein HPB47_001600 [Ixodes persulcatus]
MSTDVFGPSFNGDLRDLLEFYAMERHLDSWRERGRWGSEERRKINWGSLTTPINGPTGVVVSRFDFVCLSPSVAAFVCVCRIACLGHLCESAPRYDDSFETTLQARSRGVESVRYTPTS